MLYINREPIYRLGEEIVKSNESFLSIHKKNQRINVHNKDNIYYLTKGNVAVYSFGGELLTFNVFAPEIMCIEKLRGVKIINHFRCVTECEMYTISCEEAINIIEKNNLWSTAFDIAMTPIIIYHGRDNKITRPTARETIIQYVKYIWEFDPAQRNETSIYTFILERTNISRSLIHKVIADLEREGVLTVSRGIITMCLIE
jgi:hypothetical protein